MPDPEFVQPLPPPRDSTIGPDCLAESNPFPPKHPLPAAAPPTVAEGYKARAADLTHADDGLRDLVARLRGAAGVAATVTAFVGRLPESQPRQSVLWSLERIRQLCEGIAAETVRLQREVELAAPALAGVPWAQGE